MKNEPLVKTLHDIHTLYHHDNETSIIGRDENGNEFTIIIPTYELFQWVKTDELKESLIKYIKES